MTDASHHWEEATKWESGWWGNCCNTFGEEFKQFAYAVKMGLKTFHNGKSPYNFDLAGKSVLDIGGGPVSMLLKCVNVKGTVADPCDYPEWTVQRYKVAGIEYIKVKGEDLSLDKKYDEVWLYNVLQHTDDPALILKNARAVSKIIRIFEWAETGIADGHIHNLTKAKLDKWLGGEGKVEEINQNTARGLCYFGIFKGDLYE